MMSKERTITGHSDWVRDIFTMEDSFFISAAFDKTAIIWDTAKFDKLGTLIHDTPVTCVAATSKLIVTGCRDGKLYIYKNTTGEDVERPYLHVSTVDVRGLSFAESSPGWLVSLTFINLDVVMVTTLTGGIYFVSLSKRSSIAHMKPTAKYIWCTTVLPDGKICIGGNDGYCAVISVPSKVHHAVTSFAKRLHPQAHNRNNSASSDDANEISVKENNTVSEAKTDGMNDVVKDRKAKNAVFRDVGNMTNNLAKRISQPSEISKKKKMAFLQEMVKDAKQSKLAASNSGSISTLALPTSHTKKKKLPIPQDKWTEREANGVMNVLCTPPRDISIMPNGISASQSTIGKYTIPITKTTLLGGKTSPYRAASVPVNGTSARAISVPVEVTTSIPEKTSAVKGGSEEVIIDGGESLRQTLLTLKTSELGVSAVPAMGAVELANNLAAYLVLYETESADCFAAIRSELCALFKSLFINGTIFAHGDIAETEWLAYMKCTVETRWSRSSLRCADS